MKRKTLKLVACAAITALTLSVTACGGSDDAKTTDTVDVEETVDIEDEAEPEVEEEPEVEPEAEAEPEEPEESAEETTAQSDETLEDYFNDPTVKPLMDSMLAAYAQDGMSAAVDVKGNEFIVIIKIEDSSMIVDGIGEALDEALEQSADQFKGQVKQFDDLIGQENACEVTMRYTDPDDNVLAEKTFTAN